MTTLIARVNDELHRVTHRMFNSDRELARLENSGTLGETLAGAIRNADKRQIDTQEAQYVSEIESLRRAMITSRRELEITDFGASSEQNRGTTEAPGRKLRVELGHFSRAASKRASSALLMMKLIRALRPETVLELGTCVGISSAYQSVGLHLNGGGKLITIEGAPALAEVAEENLRTLQLDRYCEVLRGRFSDVLPQALKKVGHVDFAFIDGHHDYEATLKYFRQIKPHLRSKSVAVFDDIAWSDGMAAAWKQIVADPDVFISVDLFTMGLCTFSGNKGNFRIASS